MPELPEVETIRRELRGVLMGQRIEAVEVRHPKSFFGSIEQIVGKKIIGVERKAKVLMVEIAKSHRPVSEGEKLFLLVHLKMTGQLIYQESGIRNQESGDKKFTDHRPHFELDGRIVGGHPTADWVSELPNTHTRVVMQLTNSTLFFNDQRIFGWMKLVRNEELGKEFKNYGPDITDRTVDEDYFWKTLQKSRRAVKLVITDQKDVAGVGNIYANDGLWCAGVSPMRKAQSLTPKECNRLLKCLKEVINEGIKYGGATASDDKFVQTSGLGGKYQEHFKVYERSGQECLRCSSIIKKITLGGRGTYFCVDCQRE